MGSQRAGPQVPGHRVRTKSRQRADTGTNLPLHFRDSFFDPRGPSDVLLVDPSFQDVDIDEENSQDEDCSDDDRTIDLTVEGSDDGDRKLNRANSTARKLKLKQKTVDASTGRSGSTRSLLNGGSARTPPTPVPNAPPASPPTSRGGANTDEPHSADLGVQKLRELRRESSSTRAAAAAVVVYGGGIVIDNHDVDIAKVVEALQHYFGPGQVRVMSRAQRAENADMFVRLGIPKLRAGENGIAKLASTKPERTFVCTGGMFNELKRAYDSTSGDVCPFQPISAGASGGGRGGDRSGASGGGRGGGGSSTKRKYSSEEHETHVEYANKFFTRNPDDTRSRCKTCAGNLKAIYNWTRGSSCTRCQKVGCGAYYGITEEVRRLGEALCK